MTTALPNYPVLGAFTQELERFDRAVLGFAARFGGDQFGLLETRWALSGFMAAMVDPSDFTPKTAEQPEELLKRAYAGFTGQPCNSAVVMNVAWMRRLVEFAASTPGTKAEVGGLVTTKFVDELDETCTSKSLIYPTLDMNALGELKDATQVCTRAAITWRLRDADVAVDFADIADRTALAIVFYATVTRITQHTLATVLHPFEELLKNGVLPLGRTTEGHGGTGVTAIRLYKLADEKGSNVSKQTVMVEIRPLRPQEPPPAHSPDGTLMGVGPRGPAISEPRTAFMSCVQELASVRPQVSPHMLNVPFRLWSGFMNEQVLKPLSFGTVDPSEILLAINAATGHAPTNVETIDLTRLLSVGIGLEELALMYREGSAKYIPAQQRPTMKKPFGLPIWSDPYLHEDDILKSDDPTVAADRAMRNALHIALEEMLLPGLDKSLAAAGIIKPSVRQIVSMVIEQTFFNLFDGALHADSERVLRTGRLVDLYLRGVIPLGIRLYGRELRAYVVAAPSA